ncbi:MAG: lamin tail domain-containing protein [Phycisphaeraceae bacterium]|nr:lamin tail domain-containing protein [Phycisphaeraceae bacterium]
MSYRRNAWIAAAAVFAATAAASAQQTVTQWTFNSPVPDGNTGTGVTTPAIGAGVLTDIGGITSTFASGDASGGSSDPNVGDDSGYQTTNYPAQGAGSGTAGVEFAVSTVGFTNIVVTWDHRHSNTSSRFSQFMYSTDGVNFIAGPVFEATGGDTWFNGRTADLSAVPAASNNPNFKFRIVAVFDPGLGSLYSAATATSTYAGGGTNRFDMVTVSGMGSSPTPPTGSGAAQPGAICSTETTVTVSVAASGGLNPPSTGITVTANLSTIGGSASQTLFDDGTNGDTVPGDGVFSYTATLPGNLTPGSRSLGFTVADAQARSSNGSITLAVANCSQNSTAPMVISAVFGGGGNSGAPLYADFVELHNRSGSTVNLAGWSLQYAPSFSQQFDASRTINLSGSIPAGRYVLIQTNRGSDINGLPFTADILGYNPLDEQSVGVAMANDAGRLALCNSTTPIGTNCADASVVDFVGYGSSALCFEGAAATGNLSNILSAVRKNNGCQDTNQNFNDFDIAFPDFPRSLASPAVLCGPSGPDCFNRTAPNQNGLPIAGGPDGTADSAQCIGDWDRNNVVEPSDIAQFVQSWSFAVSNPGLPGVSLYADIDCNGAVEPADIGVFIQSWIGGLTSGQLGCP